MLGLIKSAIFAIGGNAVNAILNVVFIVICIASYGLEFFGAYGWHLAAIMTSMILSKPNVWQGFVKHYVVESDELGRRSVLIDYFIIDLIFSLLSSGFCVFVLFFLTDSFYVFLLIPYIAFYNNGFSIGFLRCNDCFGYYALAQSISASLKVLLVIVFHPESAVEFVCVVLLFDGAVWLILYSFVIMYSSLNLRAVFFNQKHSSIIYLIRSQRLKFVLGTYLTAMFDLPVAHLDRVIVGLFLSPAGLGIYILLRRFGVLFSVIVEPISYVLFPEFSRYLKNGRDGLKSAILLARYQSCFVFAVGCMSFLTMLFFFETIDEFVFDAQLGSNRGVLLLMIFIQTAGLMFTWMNPIIVAAGMLKKNNFVVLSSNIIYLFMLFILSYFWGLVGAILALGFQYISTTLMKWYLIKNIK